ncbi:outer membrane lipoprotein-sorting protein [Bacteriovoracaceae bacterium]|nr:outer membrane lipoprotein-sorting protein [Bacteriovoracaceae bacterium]
MKICPLIIALLGSLFISVSAKTPEQKGDEIAKKMENANNGYIGEESDMEMILIDAHGSRVERLMKGNIMEVKKDGDKSISTFLNPRDVKGTKMLTWSHKEKDDDQWLYLPSLKRVKRINSSSKSSSFMGSEFSFEDLGSQEREKFTYKLLTEKKVNGLDSWVLERKPKTKSGYTKQIVVISKKYMNPLSIEYYDRKNELLKKAEFSGYKKYTVKGKTLFRASKIHMKNKQTKKESIFEWKNRKIGVSQKSRNFTKRSLK